jgi:hypothetical protein
MGAGRQAGPSSLSLPGGSQQPDRGGLSGRWSPCGLLVIGLAMHVASVFGTAIAVLARRLHLLFGLVAATIAAIGVADDETTRRGRHAVGRAPSQPGPPPGGLFQPDHRR